MSRCIRDEAELPPDLPSAYQDIKGTRFYYLPVISVLSVPTFAAPPHMPVACVGVSTGLERLIEFAGRLCYMSQSNPAERTTAEYIENIKKQAHGSVLEHATISVLLEGVSRTLTHELVRHRAGFAYSQLSQRYVGEEHVAFVIPPAVMAAHAAAPEKDILHHWMQCAVDAKKWYSSLSDTMFDALSHITDKVLRRKAARESARSVLLNAAETKIVVTANVRAWRTMLELRLGLGAEEEIRRMSIMLLDALKLEAPWCFNDFEILTDKASGKQYGVSQYHKV